MKRMIEALPRHDRSWTTATAWCATRAGLPAAFALSLAALLTANPAPAQTISCANAQKPAEFAICNSEDLQVLDEKLDAAYRREMDALGEQSSQQRLSSQQAQWETRRNSCKTDINCLQQSYEARLSAIANNTASNSTAPILNFKRFAGNGG